MTFSSNTIFAQQVLRAYEDHLTMQRLKRYPRITESDLDKLEQLLLGHEIVDPQAI
jgi:hypothetical protein